MIEALASLSALRGDTSYTDSIYVKDGITKWIHVEDPWLDDR
jgi:ribonuclease HI